MKTNKEEIAIRKARPRKGAWGRLLAILLASLAQIQTATAQGLRPIILDIADALESICYALAILLGLLGIAAWAASRISPDPEIQAKLSSYGRNMVTTAVILAIVAAAVPRIVEFFYGIGGSI